MVERSSEQHVRFSASSTLPAVIQFSNGTCQKAIDYSRRVNDVKNALTRLSARAAHLRTAVLNLADGTARYAPQRDHKELQVSAALVVEFHLLKLAGAHPQLLVGTYAARFDWLQQLCVPEPSHWYQTGTIIAERPPRGGLPPPRGDMESFQSALLRNNVDTSIQLPPVIDAENDAAEAACTD